MRPKPHYPLNLNAKLLLMGLTLALILLFTLRSNFSSSSPSSSFTQNSFSQDSFPPIKNSSSKNTHNSNSRCSSSTCSKLPSSLSHALIHYSTSNITPQQTLQEISITSHVLHKKSPCNFLVFGLGHDSLMWSALNYGGRTLFLEEDESWIEQIKRRFPMLESHHVVYDSKVNEANNFMGLSSSEKCTVVRDVRDSSCSLALKGLPKEVYEIEWDLIMVDAPTGYFDEAPGRMTAIYTAGMIARNREDGETDVFVHDVDRNVEDNFSKEFLCEGYMKKQEGRLRHFTIPSHRDGSDKPFCP